MKGKVYHIPCAPYTNYCGAKSVLSSMNMDSVNCEKCLELFIKHVKNLNKSVKKAEKRKSELKNARRTRKTS